MKVLVDTPIWSLALRRKAQWLDPAQRGLVTAWAELVRRRELLLIGPLRQEILSGLRDQSVFERLREHLRAFTDEPLTIEDYEEAARCNNLCRAKGVAGSGVDFLICAVSLRRGLEVFTTDADFGRYARHLPIRLYTPDSGRIGR